MGGSLLRRSYLEATRHAVISSAARVWAIVIEPGLPSDQGWPASDLRSHRRRWDLDRRPGLLVGVFIAVAGCSVCRGAGLGRTLYEEFMIAYCVIYLIISA